MSRVGFLNVGLNADNFNTSLKTAPPSHFELYIRLPRQAQPLPADNYAAGRSGKFYPL